MPKKEAIDVVTMKRALARVSYEIIERNEGIQDIVLVGIKTYGIYIAQRLAERLRQLEDIDIPVDELDIILYRDGVKDMEKPKLHSSDVSVSIEGKEVISVDDVLYTGRTIHTAMDAVIDLGHSGKVSLTVLVDRGHRELPIRADYVGKNILASKIEEVIVEMEERDGADRIMISKGNEQKGANNVVRRRVSK